MSSFTMAATTFICFCCLDIDLSFLWSVVVFFLNFVPNIGPMVAELLPMPFIYLDPNQGMFTLTLAYVIPLLLHATLGTCARGRGASSRVSWVLQSREGRFRAFEVL